MSDILINKVQSIQRCMQRVQEEFQLANGQFRQNYSRQDAAILNITRACEQAIDLANYVIKQEKLGIPMSSGESFSLLARKNIISSTVEEKMIRMVGFRNVAVHEYQALNIDIVEAVIQQALSDLMEFSDCMINYQKAKQ